MVTVDAADRKILDLLCSDASVSQKKLAQRLGVSEPHLSKKISTLTKAGVIKEFSIEINYDLVGNIAHAVTLVKMGDKHTKNLNSLIEKVSKMNDAVEIYTTFGDYDLYVRWVCKTYAEIMDAVNYIADDVSVEDVNTITFGRCYKRERGPKLEPSAETVF